MESMAGWIFADLLLVLFLVGLGSAVTHKPPPPKPQADVHHHKPKPPPIVGMQTRPEQVVVQFDAAALSAPGTKGAAARSTCREIRTKTRNIADKHAALILVFGGAPDVVQGQ